ncbi:uncharacterized protein FPOAC1_013418, partial [Fusarium poae]|uniref:uncharacterized protein n=1 Tax=Fusarium poae TaxID=36050 RepID=UPI001D04B619
ESGRGGRDRRKSESVVVIRRSWLEQQQRQQPQEEQKGWAWDKDTVEYVGGSRCRREVLDREMDGFIDRFGCEEEEEEMCDVCRELVERRAMVGPTGGNNEERQREESIVEEAEEEADAVLEREVEVEEETAAEAAAEADYDRSRRLIRQVETERRLQVMREAEEVGRFEDILAES